MESTSTISTDSKNTSNNKKSSVWNVLFIIAILIGISGLIYIVYTQKNKMDNLESMQKELAVKALMEQSEEMRDQNVENYAKYQALYGQRVDLLNSLSKEMIDKLTPEGQEGLQVIIVEINNNPETLGLEYERLSDELKKAVDVVKRDLYKETDLQSYGNIPSKNSDGSDTNLKPGDVATIQGLLKIKSEESLLGTIFEVYDENYDMPFYFTFSDQNKSNVMDYVENNVKFMVKITRIDPEKGVLYEVTSGPENISD